jgi:ABC-type polysaccharide/polyol phosphate export permease
VKQLHELREKKESLHPQFVLRSLQAEMMCLRALIVQSDQVSAALLNCMFSLPSMSFSDFYIFFVCFFLFLFCFGFSLFVCDMSSLSGLFS